MEAANVVMPFRPENRMVTFLVIMMFLTSVLGGGIVLMTVNSEKSSTPANLFIGGILVLFIKDLIWLVHEYAARRDIKQDLTTHNKQIANKLNEIEFKTDGNLQAEVERVRIAEREQMLDDPEFVKRVAAQVISAVPCDDIALRAIEAYECKRQKQQENK